MRGERRKRPAVREELQQEIIYKLPGVQEGLKKDLEKRKQKRLVKVRCHRDYSEGKYPEGYIMFRYGADQNVTSLACGTWSRLIGVD